SDTPVAVGGTANEAGSGGQPQAGSSWANAGDGGQAGASTEPLCPTNLFAADGKSCAGFQDGFECSDGSMGPCELGNAIVCTNGIWWRRESFPAPCGGAGGVGG
ncbi:MAG TPA: hypothetical protein VER04_22440, partial [Polyangiaceae bacterium]|nr:hypothetical protein [Polyangiaceae bacterium]